MKSRHLKIFVIGTVFLLTGALAYYKFFYNSPQSIIESYENTLTDNIVQVSSEYISQQKIIEVFGVSNVIYVSDDYFRLKLNPENMQKLVSLNYPYTVLPASHSHTKSGMGIYKVEIKEPVYSQKLQVLANYGTIIKNHEKGYLLWINKNRTEEVSALPDVAYIRPFYNYEKISPAFAADYSEAKKTTSNVYMLINDNNFEVLKNLLKDNRANVISESDKSYIGQSLEAINLQAEFYYSDLNTILENVPQIVEVTSN